MNVLIVTYARFPEGDAEAVRLHTFGKLLRYIGHNVSYVGMGYDNYLEKLKFDDFNYTSLRKKAENKWERLYFYLEYNYRLEKYLSEYMKSNKVDVILFADLSPITIMLLKKVCKKNNIQLVADSVEWYSPEQFKYRSLAPSMILKNIENKYVIDENVKVIAISKYLYNHFTNKGCKCIRIPVILDVNKLSYKKNIDSNKLTVLYAGSPGKKDYVHEMLKGILLLNEDDMCKLKFIFAGVSEEDIKNMFDVKELGRLRKCVKFLGRIERCEVLEYLSKADFTVLLRESKQRYAKAGFPTKVVESLATGTPVILNLSSDLGDYINDMEEGLIVKECSALEFSNKLRLAINLSKEERTLMKTKARICAEKHFKFTVYEKEVEEIIAVGEN